MWTVTTNDHQNLILIKSDETLDFNSLRNVLKQIYFENEGRYSSYNRFADLSGLEKIEVDIDTLVSNVQVYRKVNPPKGNFSINYGRNKKYRWTTLHHCAMCIMYERHFKTTNNFRRRKVAAC